MVSQSQPRLEPEPGLICQGTVLQENEEVLEQGENHPPLQAESLVQALPQPDPDTGINEHLKALC